MTKKKNKYQPAPMPEDAAIDAVLSRIKDTAAGHRFLRDLDNIIGGAHVLFRDHNCPVCRNGELPCEDIHPRHCGNLIAIND